MPLQGVTTTFHHKGQQGTQAQNGELSLEKGPLGPPLNGLYMPALGIQEPSERAEGVSSPPEGFGN